MNRFRVWCPELGQKLEDGLPISAIDGQAAAEEWGEWEDSNSAEYYIIGGGMRTVMTHNLDSRETKPFVVSAYSVARYKAEAVEPS